MFNVMLGGSIRQPLRNKCCAQGFAGTAHDLCFLTWTSGLLTIALMSHKMAVMHQTVRLTNG